MNATNVAQLKPLPQVELDMQRVMAHQYRTGYDRGFLDGEAVGQRRADNLNRRISDRTLGVGFVFGFAMGVIVAVSVLGFFLP